LFCRLAAKELSQLQPTLQAANVRLLAVGLEDVGLDDFLAGNYFAGEVVVDIDQRCYKALGFRKMNIFSLGPALLAKVARDAISKGKAAGIKNDLKGDGFQNGGLIVVPAGGSKVLYEYRQENPADHAPNSDILQALGISEAAVVPPVAAPAPSRAAECTDVCGMPAK
ncbi:prostamide/prostaglandin F synthase, partial [Hyalella azteca]|uniref:Prostamide/prostaglandin F synthase n=1 Tax=Hyalella azteca TaxID=294128 RepID=A0A8B7MYS7_HYAAZ